MLPHEGQPKAWALGFQHLLLSIIGFGMRVYSQHPDVQGRESQWSSIHERVAAAILDPAPCVTVDQRGRLIIVDDSPRSAARDRDGDGFDETVTIGASDAGLVVAGDPLAFYDSVRAKIGDWEVFPSSDETTAEPPAEVLPAPVPANIPPVQSVAPDAEPQAPVEETAAEPVDTAPSEVDGEEQGVVLQIGATVDGFQPKPVALNISDTRLNQFNMGVVGDLGTGKTQLLKSLIMQISSAARRRRASKCPRYRSGQSLTLPWPADHA